MEGTVNSSLRDWPDNSPSVVDSCNWVDRSSGANLSYVTRKVAGPGNNLSGRA